MVDFADLKSPSVEELRVARSIINENGGLLGGDDAEGDDIEFHPDREPNIPNVTASINGRSATITITDTQTAAEKCGEIDDMA